MTIACLSVALFGVLGLNLVVAVQVAESGVVSCDPVYINGGAQLRACASRGKGMHVEPYVIEGLSIDAQASSQCLKIQNVDSYFIMRRCRLVGV